MTLRTKGTSTAYRDREPDGEDEYVLKWSWTRPTPASYFTPAEGGVEPEAVYRNGERLQWPDVPAGVLDELVADAHEQMREWSDAA